MAASNVRIWLGLAILAIALVAAAALYRYVHRDPAKTYRIELTDLSDISGADPEDPTAAAQAVTKITGVPIENFQVDHVSVTKHRHGVSSVIVVIRTRHPIEPDWLTLPNGSLPEYEEQIDRRANERWRHRLKGQPEWIEGRAP